MVKVAYKPCSEHVEQENRFIVQICFSENLSSDLKHEPLDIKMLSYIFNVVVQVVEDWVPKKYAKEDKYRDELMRFLRERLPSEDYAVGKGAFLDIEINDEIGIELKRNLKSKTERNRLVGQVTDFLKQHSYALVVLCGKVEQKIVNDLNSSFKFSTLSSSLIQNKIVKIISKDKSQILKEKNKRVLLQRINKPSFSLIDYMKQTQTQKKKEIEHKNRKKLKKQKHVRS